MQEADESSRCGDSNWHAAGNVIKKKRNLSDRPRDFWLQAWLGSTGNQYDVWGRLGMPITYKLITMSQEKCSSSGMT